MKTSRTILALLFFVSISSNLFAQTFEDLIQEGDKYNTEFQHQKSLESYQKADKLKPANWEVLWPSRR